MKQYIGIRFSRYGQVRIGAYDGADDTRFVFGQAVVAVSDGALALGRVVWHGQEIDYSFCTSRRNHSTKNSTKSDNHGKSNHEGASPRSKVDFPENSEKIQIQHYLAVRPASNDELVVADSNNLLSEEAFRFCKKCICERGTDMKLIDVEVLLDKSKMIFYFTAPSRIDFRELVKDLVREYRTRIELRQIGVRHETQMLGTLGSCGMVVCCRRFLKEFAPVTIKMAKEQNLFLNPAKISGMCGRLLCCLSYEQESYDAFHRASPAIGKKYQTDKGLLRVVRSNMFRNTIFVLNDAGQEEEINVDEWSLLRPQRAESGMGNSEPAVSNPLYDYMGMNSGSLEEEASLAELLEDNQYEQGSERAVGRGKKGHAQSQASRKPRQNFTSRPREKAQKRELFDTDTV